MVYVLKSHLKSLKSAKVRNFSAIYVKTAKIT